MALFSKNVVHFGFFTNEMECERGKQDFSNKVIVLNARKMSFKKYYSISLFQLLQRQIYEGYR